MSASTTQFALKLKIDDVGNGRAQPAMKAHKKWSDLAAEDRPVQVKASVVMTGEKLTVVSID